MVVSNAVAAPVALAAGAAAVAALLTYVLRRPSKKAAVERPKIGVAAIISDPSTGKVVLGVRAGSHGASTWQFPGGHLEMSEDPTETASRELEEETGLVVAPRQLRTLGFTNDIFAKEGKHYVTLFTHAEWDGKAQPQRLEPNKCLGWHWKSWEEIRELDAAGSVFLPIHNLLANPSFSPPGQ